MAWFVGHKSPIIRTYVFVAESLRYAQSSRLKNACWVLMGRFPFPELSESGTELMSSDYTELLLKVRESREMDKAMFATVSCGLLSPLPFSRAEIRSHHGFLQLHHS